MFGHGKVHWNSKWQGNTVEIGSVVVTVFISNCISVSLTCLLVTVMLLTYSIPIIQYLTLKNTLFVLQVGIYIQGSHDLCIRQDTLARHPFTQKRYRKSILIFSIDTGISVVIWNKMCKSVDLLSSFTTVQFYAPKQLTLEWHEKSVSLE